MNKHILLVMKWLNDKDSVTQKELNDNMSYATAVYNIYDAPFDVLKDADAAYYAATAASNTATLGWIMPSIMWVDDYFDRTGENKQDYITT